MTIYVLGANGWIPGKNETSCFMIEHKNSLLFLDSGTGMANLHQYLPILEKYDTVHILLSHYHLDHTIGLIYLDPYVRDKRLIIYGPGLLAYSNTTDYYIHSLLRKEFFSRSIDNFSKHVQIIDFPGTSFCINGIRIDVKEQSHSAPSYRISIDHTLTYATDTAFSCDSWNEESGKILLHECWDHTNTASTRHTSIWQLKNQLPLERFHKVVLIHQNPMWTKDDYKIMEDMICGTNISIAQDGMILRV